jgi:CRISPR/Cas system-associated protein endoribonuclease Cas2
MLIFKDLTRGRDLKKRLANINLNNKYAQIEKGFPVPKAIALHINNTLEPPIEKMTEITYVDDEKRKCYTKNLFVESHYELNLSIFERILTEEMVNEAYQEILNKHLVDISNGITEDFNITEKKNAKDYLLNYLNKDKKH